MEPARLRGPRAFARRTIEPNGRLAWWGAPLSLVIAGVAITQFLLYLFYTAVLRWERVEAFFGDPLVGPLRFGDVQIALGVTMLILAGIRGAMALRWSGRGRMRAIAWLLAFGLCAAGFVAYGVRANGCARVYRENRLATEATIEEGDRLLAVGNVMEALETYEKATSEALVKDLPNRRRWWLIATSRDPRVEGRTSSVVSSAGLYRPPPPGEGLEDQPAPALEVSAAVYAHRRNPAAAVALQEAAIKSAGSAATDVMRRRLATYRRGERWTETLPLPESSPVR